MKCEAIHELLTQYLLGDLPPNVSDELRAHLQDCDGCRAEASEIESTLDLLRDALASTSEAPASLGDSHYSRIYATGGSGSGESAGRKPVILQIGSWFTSYPHQLAAAVAMICIGGVLFGVSMVQLGGRSEKSLMMADSYAVPKGSGVPSVQGTMTEAEPLVELESIEETFDSGDMAVDVRNEAAESKSAIIYEMPDLDDAELNTTDKGAEMSYAGRPSGGRGTTAKAGKMGKGGKKGWPEGIAAGEVDFEEIDSDFQLKAGSDGSLPVEDEIEEATAEAYSLGSRKEKADKSRSEWSVLGRRMDAPVSSPRLNSRVKTVAMAKPKKKKRMALERELRAVADVKASAPPADFSPKPVVFDSVAIVKSPVVMNGTFGNRAGGKLSVAAKAQDVGGDSSDASKDGIESVWFADTDGEDDGVVRSGIEVTTVAGFAKPGELNRGVSAEQYVVTDSLSLARKGAVKAESRDKLGHVYKDMGLEKQRSQRASETLQKGEEGEELKRMSKLSGVVERDGKELNEEVRYRNLPAFTLSAEKSNESLRSKVHAKPEAPSEPDEDLTGPKFKAFGVNPFVNAKDNAFSTFAIDVDTASYTLGRNYMLKGFLPPAESVRTEEFVNFFDYGYAAPSKGTFKIYTECAPSKFGHGKQMLKIGVKGRAIGREEQETAMLTFVIDSSGSMNQMDRMGLVKKSVALLLDKLTPEDQIAIVQFGSKARLVLEHTSASEKTKILDAINSLQTSGSTNLEEAMLLAYKVAAKEFKPGASNRVLIMSDGAANIGEGAAQDILSKVKRYSKQGIFCSVFGFGIGTYNDEMLETLANKGNGTYSFIDSEAEAKRIFVDELSATLNTIASDVKIQVEFMPRFIKQYRQLGYENRQLTKKQFRDNTVDAGEVGSGQSVTALYEMEMNSRPELYADLMQCMAIVRVRYRRIDTGAIEEIEKIVSMKDMANSFNTASSKFKLAAGVAEFAEILRGSKYAAGSEFNSVAEVLRPIALEFNLDKRIRELTGMVQNAGGMSRGE